MTPGMRLPFASVSVCLCVCVGGAIPTAYAAPYAPMLSPAWPCIRFTHRLWGRLGGRRSSLGNVLTPAGWRALSRSWP
ncbi:hypothetical protein GQ53DRAFT_756261 [Thozetella sp. PMI_491]|nr:hypothetical protein GQ53DRAFT_756261 [Thozetella sp. PMI_491]